MGFRNPVTSATAVDTGAGGSAGVRLYQGEAAPGVPQGIAEWRTGLMDRNATVTLSGGTGGSNYRIDGGAAQGLSAPKIDLNVESAPAGGYRSVARISQPYEPLITANPSWLNGFRDFPGLERPRLVLQADGSVLFTGLGQNNSGASKGGVGVAAILGTVPVAFRPLYAPALLQAFVSAGVNARVDIAVDGTISYTDSSPLVANAYLMFRAVYRLDSPAASP